MKGSTTSRRLILLGLDISSAPGISINIDAEAAQIPQRPPTIAPAGDHNRAGNGHRNNSAVTIRSPFRLRGIQLINNSNAGVMTNVNNAVCKKRMHCKIRQRGDNFLR